MAELRPWERTLRSLLSFVLVVTGAVVLGAVQVRHAPPAEAVLDFRCASTEGIAYFVNTNSGSVSLVYTGTDTTIATIPVGGGSPYGVTATPDGSKVYVAGAGGGVAVIDIDTRAVRQVPGTFPNAVGGWSSPDGTQVFISNYNANTISVIDTRTDRVSRVINLGAGGSQPGWMDASGRFLYVARNSGTIAVIDLTSTTDTAPVRTIAGSAPAHTIAANSTYLATAAQNTAIQIYSTAAPSALIRTINLPAGYGFIHGLTFVPGTNYIVGSLNNRANGVTVWDASTGAEVRTFASSRDTMRIPVASVFGNEVYVAGGVTGGGIDRLVTTGDPSTWTLVQNQAALQNFPDGHTPAFSCLRPIEGAKRFASSQILLGEVTRLTITLENNNTAPLTGVTGVSVTDPLPANVRIAPTPRAATTCGSGSVAGTTAGGDTLRMTGGTIPAATISAANVKTPGTCTVTVDVIGTGAGTSTNTVPAGGITADVVGASLQSFSTPITINPALRITKTEDDADDRVTPGQTVTYTVTVRNTATVAQTGVRVQDVLPAGMTYVAASTVATQGSTVRDNVAGGTNPDLVQGDPSTGDLVATGDGFTLPAGGQLTVTYRVTVDDPITAVNFVNRAQARTTQEPVPIEASTTLAPVPANLGIDKTVIGPPTPTGNANEYSTTSRITVSNTGAVAGTYSLRDTLQLGAGTTVVRSSFARVASSTDPDRTGTLGPSPTGGSPVTIVTDEGIAAGGTEIWDVTTVFTVDPATITTAAANCSVADAGGENTGTHNTASLTSGSTTVGDDACAPIPALSVDKQPATIATGADGRADAGDPISWPIVVTNTGAVALTGVTVTDPGAPTITCPATTLAVGASFTCTASRALTQAEVTAGTVVNTATAASDQTGPVSDSVTTPIARTAAFTFDKQAATPASAGVAGPVGDTIAYTFLVTNTGNVPLTAVTVTDAKVGSVSCPSAPLAPGATVTCTASYSITQGDVNAGSVVNTATADVTPPAGVADPEDRSDGTTTPIQATNAISLAKTVSPQQVPAAGGTVTYTFLGRNTGQTTLSGVQVSDPLPGLSALSCTPAAPATLAPNATITCTATYTLTQADADRGSVVNTASITGTPPSGPAVTASESATVSVARNASLVLDKQAATPVAGGAAGPVGDTISYTFLVTNTGNVSLDPITVDDPVVGTVTCPAGPLAPGATRTCTAAPYPVTQADVDAGTVTNTATATGTPPAGVSAPTPATDTTVTPVAGSSAIELVKTADPQTVSAPGETIEYTLVATNTGQTTLTGVTITDPLPGLSALDCTPAAPATLAPAATLSCTADYVTTQADIDAGEIDNTATATGTPPAGAAVTDTATEVVDAPAEESIELVKTANPTTVSGAGQTVTYTFVATNTGNVTLSGVEVTDPLPRLSTPVCDPAAPASLAPDASITCTATYVTTQADADRGSVVNTATASGTTPDGSEPEATDEATVTIAADPSVELVKTVDPPAGAEAGDRVTYTFLATNTGNVTLDEVEISDPLDGLSDLACTPGAPTSLAPAATLRCTATYTLTQADVDAGGVDNTATVTGLDPDGAAVEDSDDAAVTVAPTPELELVKTVVPFTVPGAGSVVTYTFVATNRGNVTLDDVVITDPLPGVTIEDCDPATLAPGETLTCTASYTVTQADVDAGGVGNIATVTGTPPVGDPVSTTDDADLAIGSVPAIELVKTVDPTTGDAVGQTSTYTFVATNTGNVSLSGVEISDPLDGLSALACTPAAPATLAPGEELTCTATRAITQDDLDAGTVPNEAAVRAEDPNGTEVTDVEDAAVTLDQRPAVELDKRVDRTVVPRAGETVTYTFVATNTGNVTVDDVQVVDPLPGLSPLDCDRATPTSFGPGEEITCTADYTLTQADVDAGQVRNTATVSGIGAGGTPASDSDDARVVVPAAPSVALAKTVSPTTAARAGDDVTYTFVATNDGNVTLSGVTVTDPLDGLGPLDCDPASPATLAPGESTTCTATYEVQQADVDAGGVDNTATVTATPPVGDPVTASDSAEVTIAEDPAIELVKTVTPTSATTAGETLGYSFVASNTGNVTLTDVTIADPLAGLSALACDVPAPVTLAPAETLACTATYALTQADVDAGGVDNQATVTGTDPTGLPARDSDTATVDVAADPAIVLDKQAGALADVDGNGPDAGDTITYAFLVTNDGNVTLDPVTVTDDTVGTVSCPSGPLAPQAQITCTAAPYVLTQLDVDAGTVDNTATATGTPPVGDPVTATDQTTTVVPSDPDIELVKTAAPTTLAAAGDVVTYTFVATNTGNTTLSDVVVADPLPGLSDLVCDRPGPVTLAPQTRLTCTATYALTQADVDAGELDNTATATGTDLSGAPVSDDAEARVGVDPAPAVALVKSVSPTTAAAAGDEVTYTFVATNSGNVSLSGVEIDDPLDGLSDLVCDPVTPASLAPGASTTCTATYALTQADVDAGGLVNEATVTGSDPSGTEVADSDEAEVTVAPAPGVELVKTVSPTTAVAAGDEVTYTFVASNTGNTTLSDVEIDDPLDGLSALVCDPATPAVLAPGEATTCTASYELTQDDVDAGQVENTATVTSVDASGSEPTDTASARVDVVPAPAIELVKTADPLTADVVGDEVTYTFVATNSGNVTLAGVTVTDPLPGLSVLDCDPATPAVLAPGETTTCQATYELTQADLDRGTVRNTATAAGADPSGTRVASSDDATVTVEQDPAIEIVKTVTPETATAAGDQVRYRFVVTNTGDVTLTDVGVTDRLAGLSGIVCDPATPTSLAPGASTTCAATYELTQADVDAGEVVNTATAVGTDPTGASVDDTDDAEVTIAPDPSIELVKTASPTTAAAAGETVTYTFVATNTGNVTLGGVTVTDPLDGLSAIVCAPAAPASLAPQK